MPRFLAHGKKMDDQPPLTRIQTRNRSAIMSGGLDAFSTAGFKGATLDQIADAAGLSKPNLLYYFPSKEAIYAALLEELLKTWLDPLRTLDPNGNPIEEILAYAHRKLAMSRDFPRESRLFANELLAGAPQIHAVLAGPLRTLVDEKAQIMRGWMDAGLIRKSDPHHLIFSIWALTQHYADFDVQVRAVLGDVDPFSGADTFVDHLYRTLLQPPDQDHL